MKLLLPLFLALAFVGVAWAGPADENQDAAFLQALLDRGDFDLARDFARERSKQPAPRLQPFLDYALLRSEAELALADGDEAGFLAKLSAALPILEALANREPDVPFSLEAPPARAELLLRRGRFLAAKAATQTNPNERDRSARDAAQAFIDADTAYAAAAAKLEPLRGAFLRSADAKRLTQRAVEAYGQALYGRGWALLEHARAPGVNDQVSGQKLQQAALALEKLIAMKESTPLTSRGLALQGLSYQGVDSRRAEEAFQKVQKEKRPEAAAAQRDVRLFRLQGLAQAVQGGRKAERTKFIADAAAWLADYAIWGRTPEALELRFQLATALLDEVAERPEAERTNADSVEKLNQALPHLETVAGAVSPRRRAAEERLLAAQLLATGKPTPLGELKSFADWERRLRLDLLRLGRLGEQLGAAKEPEREKLLADRAALLADLKTEVAKTLELRPATLAGREADRWRQLRFDALLRLGQWADAAAVGEELAAMASQPDLRRQAAEQTLNLLQALKRRGEATAGAQLVAFAEKTLQQQPTSGAADLARELLGQQRYQEQKYAEAAALLEKVAPASARHAICGFQAGLAFWGLHMQQVREQKRPLAFDSEAKLKAFLLMERHLPDLEKAADAEAVRQAVNYRFTLADLQMRVGATEKALLTLQPLVEKVDKNELPADLPGGTAAQILSLALRAEALKDPSSPAALARLQAIQKLGEKGELGGGVAERFQELGQQLRTQIQQLEREGPAAAERLKTTKERFRQFLVQVEKLPQPTTELRFWLAGQHAALGDPTRAAQLYFATPKPGPTAGAGEVQNYRLSRLQGTAALRAAAALEPNAAARAPKLATLDQALAEAMQEEWAKRHPAFLKEKALADQLREKYGGPGGAIEQWDRLRQALEPHVGKSAMHRDLYQETQFNLVYSLAMAAKAESDPAAKARGLTRAAQLIVLLRRADYGSPDQKARFEALLNQPDQAELRIEVERLGQER